ncbi:MAG: hypothetical protein ACR2NU_10855, partial [Aeoliella sp.]
MSRTDKWHWHKQNRGRRLRIEPLEDRRLLATVSVGNALDVVNAPDVTSITALMNNDGGDGISLREATMAANNTTGADTITFASPLFDSPQTILLGSTELEVTETLTITGSGQGLLTIDAQQDSRVLIFSALTGDLTLEGIKLQNGYTSGNNGYLGGGLGFETTHSGGGIRFLSDGTLTLTSSTLSGNSTAGDSARGGGIYTSSGAVTLTQSTLSGNSPAGDSAGGGGISTSSGAVTLIQSTLSGNSTAGDSGDGGGIRTSSGAVTLIQSTLSGNSTAGDSADGGGIRTSSGAVTLTQSTLS